MAVSPTEVLALVKTRLGLDDSLDDLINAYIQEIQNRILNYCQIDEVPDGLKWVWASMTIDIFRIEQPNVPGIAETIGAGEKIQIGDTSVSSDKGPGLNNMSKSVIDRVVVNYQVDLNRYRKLRW